VRILVDTNVLIWALVDPGRLSRSVRSMLEDPDHEVLFSAASIWEIAIKRRLSRADFKVEPWEIIEGAEAGGFIELPVRSAAALKVADLPLLHRDPFDRLLVAQAMTEPAALYTADAQLAAYSELVVVV
jgi:PIN domain nuclease of toxin-antitoxin system